MSEETHIGDLARSQSARAAGELTTPPGPLADGIEKRLDPQVVVVWRIGAAVGALILSFASLVVVLPVIFGAPLVILGRLLLFAGWLTFVAALAARALLWPPLRYRHESYRLLPDAIEIRRGVIWRTVIHVPKTRVQHTDVSRGPLERPFGLATLVIYTAGTDHASVTLGGLRHTVAFAVRDHLIPGGGDDAV